MHPTGAYDRLLELVTHVIGDITHMRLAGDKIDEAAVVNIGASKYRSIVDLTHRPKAIIDSVESITCEVVNIISILENQFKGRTEAGKVQIILSIQKLRYLSEGNLSNSKLIKSAAYKFVMDTFASIAK